MKNGIELWTFANKVSWIRSHKLAANTKGRGELSLRPFSDKIWLGFTFEKFENSKLESSRVRFWWCGKWKRRICLECRQLVLLHNLNRQQKTESTTMPLRQSLGQFICLPRNKRYNLSLFYVNNSSLLLMSIFRHFSSLLSQWALHMSAWKVHHVNYVEKWE